MQLVEALSQSNIEYKTATKDNEIWMCCPFCGEDRFRFGINTQSGAAHCFNCEWKSKNALPILQKRLRTGELDSQVSDVQDREYEDPELPKDFEVLRKSNCTDRWTRKARRYIRKRGITDEQIKSRQIGVSLVGQYSYRIIFPVVYKKKLLGLVTRDFTDKQEPKYLNSQGMKAIYNVPSKKRGSIILSEGIVKALWIERTLKVPSGAFLGSSITREQIRMLKGFTDVVLWPDPDIAGLKGIIKIAQVLKDKFKVWLVYPLPEYQADEMHKDLIKWHFKHNARFDEKMEFRIKRRILQLKEDE